jgi:hypothetical protein
MRSGIYEIGLFCSGPRVPAPLAPVAAIGFQYDIGILAVLTDRAILFHPRCLRLFFHWN